MLFFNDSSMIISLKKQQFAPVYQKGKSVADPSIVVYVLENGLAVNRLGITVSKKIGNSVVRSRVKRIIREGYRHQAEAFQKGFDIVVIARRAAITKKSTDMEKALLKLGKAARIRI